jgi:hypothetical protein
MFDTVSLVFACPASFGDMFDTNVYIMGRVAFAVVRPVAGAPWWLDVTASSSYDDPVAPYYSGGPFVRAFQLRSTCLSYCSSWCLYQQICAMYTSPSSH